ncbi:MAG TPA: sulfatase [Bryobacteraceae bacterium]|nr:sulfatase [Bryobacteraceae bacterium]
MIQIFLCLLYMLMTATLLEAKQPAPSSKRPDIIVVMLDDLDAGTLDAALQMGFLPNIQTYVINHSVQFEQSFTSNSLCCPSRSTFLTGLYTHNHGVKSNSPPEGSAMAFHDQNTLPVWLQAAGYHTGYVGKYLNGYGSVDINHDGVEDINDQTYIPPGWNDWHGLVDPSTYRVYNYTINDNGTLHTYGTAANAYQTTQLQVRANTFVTDSLANSAEPFFLAVMPLAPHLEYIPGVTQMNTFQDLWKLTIRPAPADTGKPDTVLPQGGSFNEADVSDKPTWIQQRPLMTDVDITNATQQYNSRLKAMIAVDRLVGQLVNTLASAGAYQRTIFILTADNGFLEGQHRVLGKIVPYEDSVRVPLYISMPAALSSRVATQAIALNNDLAPTIIDLAGGQPGAPVDGTSLLPVLKNPNLPWRLRFLVEHYDDTASAAHASIRLPDVDATENVFAFPTYSAIRTAANAPLVPQMIFVQHQDPQLQQEFYDLSLDPWQMDNGAADPANAGNIQTLQGWLNQLMVCGAGTCQQLEFDSGGTAH